MVVDMLENASKFYEVHPLFQKAFEYLQQNNLENLPLGKIELEGDDLFVSVQEVTGKEQADAVLEAHRSYIDIQLPLTATESYGWKMIGDCQNVTTPYDEVNDYMLFADTPEGYVSMKPGGFVIFFPQDAHAPCIAQGTLKKIVVKVRI